MLLQSLPSIVQNPLIPLLVLFGAGLGVGIAASLVAAIGNADPPSADDLHDDGTPESSDARGVDGDPDR